MSELLARLKIEGEGRAAEQAIGGVDEKLEELTRATARSAQAQAALNDNFDRTQKELQELRALHQAGTISTTELGAATRVLQARLTGLNDAHVASRGQMKLTGAQAVNMGRQMADVGVMTAMGMSPLMTLVSQGPQIADIFAEAKRGGMGFSAVLKEIAMMAAPLVGPAGLVALIVGPIALMTAAMLKGNSEASAYSTALKATGNAAGLTGDQFQAMVEQVARVDGFGPAREALLAVAASGKVAGGQMSELGEVSVRLASLTGQSAATIAGQWANMGTDAAAFAAKVNEQYHLISLAQYERIRLLQEEGRTAEAQAELIKAAQASLAQRGEADLGILERAWKGVADAIAGAWENMKKLGAGGDQGIQNHIDLLNGRIAGLSGGQDNSARQPAIDALTKERDALQGVLAQHRALASQQAQTNVVEQSGIEASRRHAEAYATMGDNVARVNREIAKYRSDQDAIRKANPASSELDTPARRAQIEADIRKKYTESLRGGRGPQDQSSTAIDAAQQALQSAQLGLTAAVEEQAKVRHAQVEIELQTRNDQLARQVKEKSITASAADIARGYYAEAARQKDLLIEVDRRHGLEEAALAQRRAVGSYLDREAQARSAVAQTTEQQTQLELALLSRRQKLEADELEERLRHQVELHQITEAQKQEQKAALAAAQGAEAAAAARQAQVQLEHEHIELLTAQRQSQIELLQSQASTTRSSYARALMEVAILRQQQALEKAKLQEVIQSKTATAQEKAIASARMSTLEQIHAAEMQLAERDTTFLKAIDEAISAVREFKGAFRRGDWATALASLQQTIQTVQASFAAQGVGGGMMTLGSAAAGVVGGSAGRTIGGGLGIAGFGMGLGAMATAGSLGSVGMVTGLTGSAALGGAFGGAMATLGAVAGPIALAAAALYVTAKLLNVGGKPSNQGAGYDLRTGALSGNKRDDETEQAARGAGEAIAGIEEALKAAGLGLKDAVTGLVIGSRDQTQIYLESGRTLLSAVGDSGAAVDTALRALLEGATYVSDAQQRLVQSALDAGKGFEGVVQVLQAYESAQKIPQQINDAILQLSDPKAWALEELQRAQKAQRDLLKGALDTGYLTQAQFDAAAANLTTLESLQLGEVLKRFAEAVDTATEALDRSAEVTTLKATVNDGILQLTDPAAYEKKHALDQVEATYASLRAQAQNLIDAGQLGVEILGQIDQLHDLQIAHVLQGFADALAAATAAAQAQADDLQGSVADRILELTNPDAYKAKQINDDIDRRRDQAKELIAAGVLPPGFLEQLERLRGLELDAAFADLSTAVEKTVDVFAAAAPRLLAWLDSIKVSASAELSPQAMREEALRQYDAQLAKARGGDADALGSITSYADRLFSSDRDATSSAQDRLALYNRVSGEISGLTGMSRPASQAELLAPIAASLGQIQKAAEIQLAAEQAAIGEGGKRVLVANVPALQDMYVQVQAQQTERLVAANDRSREEIVAQLQSLAAQTTAALADLQVSVEGGLAGVGNAVGGVYQLAALQLQTATELADETRLQNVYLRQAG